MSRSEPCLLPMEETKFGAESLGGRLRSCFALITLSQAHPWRKGSSALWFFWLYELAKQDAKRMFVSFGVSGGH